MKSQHLDYEQVLRSVVYSDRTKKLHQKISSSAQVITSIAEHRTQNKAQLG